MPTRPQIHALGTCPLGILINPYPKKIQYPVSGIKPKPPILPSLPRIHESIMQNKPNSLNTEFNATLFATKLYRKNRPERARKNKPNQSQFTRNTRSAMRRTNREPVQSAKMAQEIDPPRTAKRTQRHLTIVPKEIYIPNSESTRQLARVLRIGLLTKTVRHATTVRMRILRVLVPLWQERRERKCNHG